jgi:hypothetical protein
MLRRYTEVPLPLYIWGKRPQQPLERSLMARQSRNCEQDNIFPCW